jgi:hypothetical protein
MTCPYCLVVEELAVQSQKMNALNTAMDYHRDDKVWYDKLFAQFGEASFLVVALNATKQKMGIRGGW